MFTITSDQHTAEVCYRKSEPVTIAQVPDYGNACDIARAISAETSGRFIVNPPAGSLVRPASFGNGKSEN
jgi:hypothetical protein